MSKRTAEKIAFVSLFAHGLTELGAAIILFIAPAGFIAIFYPVNLVFGLTLCCLIFGAPRLIAGYAIRAGKRWGTFLGMGLSIATIIISPILIFYIINPPLVGTILALLLDIPLALVVLISLSYARFDKVVKLKTNH